jgi:hypothetical protein
LTEVIEISSDEEEDDDDDDCGMTGPSRGLMKRRIQFLEVGDPLAA